MFNQFLDFKAENGLVLCEHLEMAQNNTELLYIHEVKKLGANAVLFRRFYRKNEEQSHHSEPSVCLFEVTTGFFGAEEHIKLHAALWSAGKNEVYVLKSPTRIDIINAQKPLEKVEDNLVINRNNATLVLTSQAVETFDDYRFSAHLFGTGTFWEQQEFKGVYEKNKSAYEHLLTYLMFVRADFLQPERIALPEVTIDKLLVVSMLVKFLEEIKDDKGKHALRAIYQKIEVGNFAVALEKRKSLDVFLELSKVFNGKIFDRFSKEEKQVIKNTDLKLLAQFLRANVDLATKQGFLWEQYSFQHLPIEVISAIYENFIQADALRTKGKREKGIVYTPLHLVKMLIDEVMPLDKPQLFKEEKFTVLDPTCGSGIFLVAAYKRLLQWWMINNNSLKTNVILYPSSEIAQKILVDNIFGVDVKPTAVLITIFSLTTTLVEKLSAKEIWNHLKFRDLGEKNIQQYNFFEWVKDHQIQLPTFDLVIGNPPFNPEKDKKKSEVIGKQLIKELSFKHQKIPYNNFALHFFEAGMTLSRKVCMILPASIVLYNQSKKAYEYRKGILTDFTIQKIYDFTHLREELFTHKLHLQGFNKKKGRVATLALIVENKPSDYQSIEHIVVKRTAQSQKRFEIDLYDQHLVRWDWAIDKKMQLVWKTNLLGGGQLFNLAYRLSLLETLESFMVRNKPDFCFYRGYKTNKNNKAVQSISFIKAGDKIASIDENGNWKVDGKGEDRYITVGKITEYEKLYTPPFLVIAQTLGKRNIPSVVIQEYKPKPYLYFNENFTGIKADSKHIAKLKKIQRFIQHKYNDLYVFYILLYSGATMVLRETILRKDDIANLPYPEEEQYLQLTKSEKIIQDDVLRYYRHSAKSPYKDGKILVKSITEKELRVFGEVFCAEMNSDYEQVDAQGNILKWQAFSIYQTPTLTIYEFGYGGIRQENIPRFEQTKLSHLDRNLYRLIFNTNENQGVLYTRVGRIYEHVNGYDCIFFIKPNNKRFWLKSMALRDADEVFVDFRKAGF